MRTTWLSLIALITIVVIAAGCGSKRTYVGPGGKVTVNQKGGAKTVEVQTDKGKATIDTGKKTITEAELGVPVYPGATVEVSGNYEGTEAGKTGSMQQTMLTTSDDFDKVLEFYKSKLKNVKNQYSQTAGDTKMAMFSLAPGDSQISVHIVTDPKKNVTNIQVMKMRQEK